MVERSAASSSGWVAHLQGDPLPWLLELENPSARYLTLRHVLDRPEDDPEVIAARAAILHTEPAASILLAQWPRGYWVKPDRGYSPKYRATMWQILFLAELGAPRDKRIARACEFVFRHSRRDDGLFTAHRQASSDMIACLNGNMLWALAHFGYLDDPRLVPVLDGLAAIGIDKDLVCHGEPHRPCAWSALKVIKGLNVVPADRRSPQIQAILNQGVALLLAHGLARASFSHDRALSPLWFRFGFPLGYTSDLLELLEVVTAAGVTDDPRLVPAIDFMLSKQDRQGRWHLESTPSKMWASFGEKGRPNKWVTLRVLRVLRQVHG